VQRGSIFNTFCDLWRKVRTSRHSERYGPSDNLIQRLNSYAPRSRRCTDRREEPSRGTGQQSKNPPNIEKITTAL
jgi:hypothetical protein